MGGKSPMNSITMRGVQKVSLTGGKSPMQGVWERSLTGGKYLGNISKGVR